MNRDGIAESELRRWLSLLHRPDSLALPELGRILEAHGRSPDNMSTVNLGRAAAELLKARINALRPPDDAPREERLPYEVLKTCFLDGAKLWQAANRLGMSERQMTRERTRAIRLLKAELESPAAEPEYRSEPIPAILGFLHRPELSRVLQDALRQHRLVLVHGPPGVGKTSLVAELAADIAKRTPTFWYRFRDGVNDSGEALLFELGEYVHSHHKPELAAYLAESIPTVDTGLATRLALKALSGSAHLLVFDDYHVVDDNAAVAGLLEEAVARLPDLRVATIGRHRDEALQTGASVGIPPMTQSETMALLTQLGIDAEEDMASTIHTWTQGIPHLVKLAASWLKTATPSEIAQGIEALSDREEVQDFLFRGITDLIGPDDRVVLEAASIFRDRFTDDALAFVADRTRGEVHDTSRRLVRAYIATRSRSGDVAFFHNSVREYVYDRLALDWRRELHKRTALWYRRNGQPDEATHHAMAARKGAT